MSGDGLLSLRWNNHRSSFLHILSVLRTKDSYSDVTLACDGHFYAVHKFVLSTCSDYFVEMIEKTPCKHPVIVLKDIQKGDLEALLNYMYLGEVNVLQNDLARLIKAAECLRIKGLAVPDEAPTPNPPPTPGGGEGGSGGYNNYADGRSSNKQRRRRYESENSEPSSSPIRKRPATEDTSREKASPERRQSRDSGGVASREPTDSHTRNPTDSHTRNPTDSHTRNPTDSHTRNPPSGSRIPPSGSRIPPSGSRIPPSGRDARNFDNEGKADLSNVKMEPEELKHEDEPNYVEIEDSSDADTNTGTGPGEGSNSTTQPPRSSSADASRVKVERSSPGSSSQGGFQPQSIEEIVSQALPGASIVTGDIQDGSGGPWDGDEGDSYQSFPFSEQQQGSGPGGMHPGSNMGPQHSGTSWDSETSSYDLPHLMPWNMPRNSANNVPQFDPLAQNPEIGTFHKRYSCHVCGYRGATPSLIQTHMRKHTGEKPFKCTHCDYSSAKNSNVNAHIKYHCRVLKNLSKVGPDFTPDLNLAGPNFTTPDMNRAVPDYTTPDLNKGLSDLNKGDPLFITPDLNKGGPDFITPDMNKGPDFITHDPNRGDPDFIKPELNKEGTDSITPDLNKGGPDYNSPE